MGLASCCLGPSPVFFGCVVCGFGCGIMQRDSVCAVRLWVVACWPGAMDSWWVAMVDGGWWQWTTGSGAVVAMVAWTWTWGSGQWAVGSGAVVAMGHSQHPARPWTTVTTMCGHKPQAPPPRTAMDHDDHDVRPQATQPRMSSRIAAFRPGGFRRPGTLLLRRT